jgi:hypothetical protein
VYVILSFVLILMVYNLMGDNNIPPYSLFLPPSLSPSSFFFIWAVVQFLLGAYLITAIPLSSLLLPLLPPLPGPPPPIAYASYRYKLLMSLGLMCIDNQKIQTRIGDRGGIKFLIGRLLLSPGT